MKKSMDDELPTLCDVSGDDPSTVISDGNHLSRMITLPESDLLPQIKGVVVEKLIGKGGMGEVWLGTQENPRRKVAVKILRSNRWNQQTAEVAIRFQQEIEIAANLEHPGIANIISGHSAEGNSPAYYIMQYVEGESLNSYVIRTKCGVKEILRLFLKICDAVEHAHRKGVIHRDLKPDNILVSTNGAPKLLDFGLAKVLEKSEEYSDHYQTIDGTIAGTPAYMAPEQAAGDIKNIDTRSDIYSLGMILYHLLTNHFPYEISGHVTTVLRRIIEEEPLRPRKFNAKLDSEMELLLLKCISKKPHDRYLSVHELSQDIEFYLDKKPMLVGKSSAPYFFRKWIVRNRKAVALAAFVAFSALIAGVYHVRSIVIARDAEEGARSLTENSLGRLSWQLKDIGRLELLDETTENTLVYYNNLPENRLNPARLSQKASAWEYRAEVLRSTGRVIEALEHLEQAAEWRQTLMQGHEIGEINLWLRNSRLRAEFCMHNDSLRSKNLLRQNVDYIIDRQTNRHELVREHALALEGLGDLSSLEKAWDDAVTYYREFGKLAAEIRENSNTSDAMQEELWARAKLAHALGQRKLGEDVEIAIHDFDYLVVEIRKLAKKYPTNVRYGRNLADALNNQALLIYDRARSTTNPSLFSKALKDIAKSTQLLEEAVLINSRFLNWEPDNSIWRTNQLNTLINLARFIPPTPANTKKIQDIFVQIRGSIVPDISSVEYTMARLRFCYYYAKFAIQSKQVSEMNAVAEVQNGLLLYESLKLKNQDRSFELKFTDFQEIFIDCSKSGG